MAPDSRILVLGTTTSVYVNVVATEAVSKLKYLQNEFGFDIHFYKIELRLIVMLSVYVFLFFTFCKTHYRCSGRRVKASHVNIEIESYKTK